MPDIEVDTHTHTNVSQHAFSTLEENIRAAKELGLRGVAMTNHGPLLGDGACDMHFSSARHLPKYVGGLRLFSGAEVDIMTPSGELDIREKLLADLEVVIASMHTPCFKERDFDSVTTGWLNVLDNENIDILGHMGDGRFFCDYEKIVRKVKETGKIIEINNHSFLVRPNSLENCTTIARLCKKYSVPVVMSTDAHFSPEIGIVPDSRRLLTEIEFPEELILNTRLERFCDYLGLEY